MHRVSCLVAEKCIFQYVPDLIRELINTVMAIINFAPMHMEREERFTNSLLQVLPILLFMIVYLLFNQLGTINCMNQIILKTLISGCFMMYHHHLVGFWGPVAGTSFAIYIMILYYLLRQNSKSIDRRVQKECRNINDMNEQ